MKRFLITFAFLIVSLFLVVSGVDAALDHLSHSPAQNSFTLFDEQGTVIVAYEGDLSGCKAYARPLPIAAPRFLHRT